MTKIQTVLSCLLVLCAPLTAQEAEPPDPTLLMPTAEQVRGWAPAAEPGVYEPENLFEYIDGAAE
ncbi:MAG: hypothetical protein GXP25_17375, partial [Planctomycetes bacterium]|nr:hypothetical protein [Planctomycetota bacterium]